jgi:hypothetical protein
MLMQLPKVRLCRVAVHAALAGACFVFLSAPLERCQAQARTCAQAALAPGSGAH